MPYTKVIALILSVVVAFFAGYGLSNGRAYGQVLPTLMNSSDLSVGLLMARFADLIDAGDSAKARLGLLAVAII